MEAWDRGAEVFPNKGCSGKVDMVLGINGGYIPVDVKVEKWNHNNGCWRSPSLKNPDVWLVLVNPETRVIRWPYIKGTSTPKCPEGLEDFWK